MNRLLRCLLIVVVVGLQISTFIAFRRAFHWWGNNGWLEGGAKEITKYN